jgi:hypothetical protein
VQSTCRQSHSTRQGGGATCRRHFQLESYRVLTNPIDTIRASMDPRMVALFRRIMRGEHDCGLCRVCLNFDPKSDSSPGLVGYLHGDLDGIDAIAVAACCRCVRAHGDDGTARAICQEFVDEVCGGGEVTLVRGGRA